MGIVRRVKVKLEGSKPLTKLFHSFTSSSAFEFYWVTQDLGMKLFYQFYLSYMFDKVKT